MKNNYPEIEISHDNSEIDNGYTSTLSTPLSASTEYYLKLTFDGSVYTLSLSTDGSNYTSIGTLTSSLKPYTPLQATYLGRTLMADDTTEYFNGIINLDGCYIKIDNTTWWRGAESITKIQLRHDTAANWTSVNPILLEGEVGIETDTRKQKFGDGTTAWNSLPYDAGSTALQSITSSNVTTALGYTPVNKAGDTMSGALTFTRTYGGVIALNAIPEGGYSDIQYTMANGLRVGFVRASNISATERNLQISVCNNSGSPTSNFILRCNNDVNYCTFPNTTCCDGQWVKRFRSLSTSTAQGNYEIDISSLLPNDNFSYEVELVFAGYRSSGDSSSVVNIADRSLNITSSTDINTHSLDGVTEFDGNHKKCGEIMCTIVVGSTRKFYYNICKANLTTACLIMTRYRRIGTNA
jgi:hypothetical protein